ncbi:MAG: leucine-rich repeat domain-containing protein, partial [Oscillospiraceae bacterium]|nr:leucine-rich repeat domain-containing protein [Oscillospiraceae bacterium]
DYAVRGTPWEKYRTRITSVEISKDITYIGKFSFMQCSKLSEVVFEEDTVLETIGWGAFGYCTSLKTVTIPVTVKTVDGYAFYYSTGLTTVIFGENSVLESIGMYAFWNDIALNTVSGMPEGVLIGEGAFYNSGYTIA